MTNNKNSINHIKKLLSGLFKYLPISIFVTIVLFGLRWNNESLQMTILFENENIEKQSIKEVRIENELGVDTFSIIENKVNYYFRRNLEGKKIKLTVLNCQGCILNKNSTILKHKEERFTITLKDQPKSESKSVKKRKSNFNKKEINENKNPIKNSSVAVLITNNHFTNSKSSNKNNSFVDIKEFDFNPKPHILLVSEESLSDIHVLIEEENEKIPRRFILDCDIKADFYDNKYYYSSDQLRFNSSGLKKIRVSYLIKNTKDWIIVDKPIRLNRV